MAIGILHDNVLTVGFSMIGVVYGGAMLGFLGQTPREGWWLDWHLNGVCLLFAATHASFVGLILRTAAPHLAGEELHALTQLGTIAFAYGLRQWLGGRFGHLAAPASGSAPMPPSAAIGPKHALQVRDCGDTAQLM